MKIYKSLFTPTHMYTAEIPNEVQECNYFSFSLLVRHKYTVLREGL